MFSDDFVIHTNTEFLKTDKNSPWVRDSGIWGPFY